METARQTLRTRKTTMRCQELVELLTRLGFIVRDGRRGGHKIFTHSGLPEFTSASFNCGHGRNPEIKPAYIQNILRIIEAHEDSLKTYLTGGGPEND